VSGRLVRAGVQAEVEHQRSLILGGVDVRAAKRVGQVVAVEGRASSGEDLDTVSLELQSIDGLRAVGENNRVGVHARAEVLVLDRGSIEGNGVVSHHLTLSTRGHIELLIREESQVVPVAVLVRVGGGHVLGGAQTNIHGLNGPLELRQQDVVGGLKDASALEAVNTDQAEPDSFNINIMNFWVHEDVVAFCTNLDHAFPHDVIDRYLA